MKTIVLVKLPDKKKPLVYIFPNVKRAKEYQADIAKHHPEIETARQIHKKVK